MPYKPMPYTQDFYHWTQEQAQLLRQGRWQELDIDHLVEEIEDLGNRHYDQLESRLAVLIGHLLKWEFQPHLRSNSWQATLDEQRYRIERLLQRNPSLRVKLPEAYTDAWYSAVAIAIRDTNLPRTTFPSACPYAVEQVLDPAWTPKP